MYTPKSFRSNDAPKLFDFIDQNSFALLVSQLDGVPIASHLPLLLDRTASKYGTLFGHLARENPQWRMTERRAVVEIERLEGKWKLSQNHSRERRQRVAQALRNQTDENARAIARLMETDLKEIEQP